MHSHSSTRLNQQSFFKQVLSTSAVALALGVAAQPSAQAQGYPNKPIKLVIAVPAGGPLDNLARILGEGMSGRLGQPIVVESRVGGTGAVAMVHLIQQSADGYTIHLTANAAFALTPLLKKMPHKPIDDFTFIGRAVFAPSVLAVTATSPAKNLKEFVALAKSKPGQLNYSTMLGIPQHVDFEKFKQAKGTDIVAVSYPGGAPIVNDMLGQLVQATLLNAAIFTEYIRAGRIRGLATTAAKRLPYLPEVPTMAEAGYPNLKLDEGVFYAFVGPVGMPQAVVDRLYQALIAAVHHTETYAKLNNIGFEPSLLEGTAFKRDLQRDLVANEGVLKTLNIKLE